MRRWLAATIIILILCPVAFAAIIEEPPKEEPTKIIPPLPEGILILEKQSPTAEISISESSGAPILYIDKATGIFISATTNIDDNTIKPVYSAATIDTTVIGTGIDFKTSDIVIDSKIFQDGTLKQNIILKEYHDVSFDFTIPVGYVINPMPDGSYMITDPSPEGRLGGIIIKAPFGYDSNTTERKYVPMKYERTGTNTLTLKFDKYIRVHNFVDEKTTLPKWEGINQTNKTSGTIEMVWVINGTSTIINRVDYPYYVPITYPLTIDPTYVTGGEYTYFQDFWVNSTSTLTNYQVKEILDNRTGTSTTPGFYYTNGTTRSDWADIAWTNTTNAVLSYWKENRTDTATNTTWWINVPSIADNNTTKIRLFFGNSSKTTSYMYGEGTFELFDDFPGSSLDTSKWTQLNGVASVSNSEISYHNVVGQAQQGFKSTAAFGTSYSVVARHKQSSGFSSGYNDYAPSIGFNDGTNAQYVLFYGTYPTANKLNGVSNNGGTGSVSFTTNPSSNTYYRYELKRNSTTSAIFDLNNGEQTKTLTTKLRTNALPVIYAQDNTGTDDENTITLDWIFVRKYTQTEPVLNPSGGVGQTPVSSFTASNEDPCSVDTVTFNDTSSNTPVDWDWYFWDNETKSSDDQNPTYIFTPGTYNIRLNASNPAGWDWENKTGFIVSSNCSALFEASFNSNVTCGNVPFDIQFNDTSTGTPSIWNWSFGEGNYSELQNPVFRYNTTGLYTINFSANNTQQIRWSNITNYIRAVPDWYICPVIVTTIVPTWAPEIMPSTEIQTQSWFEWFLSLWWVCALLILGFILLVRK